MARFSPYSVDREVYRKLLAVHRHLGERKLDARIRELVEIRAAQLTGCAYCVDMHLTAARAAGVDERKLDLLTVWSDAGIFDAREQAALALAEAMTRLGHGSDVDEETWQAARDVFDDDELSTLLVSIGLIQTFSRINVAVRRAPAQRVESPQS